MGEITINSVKFHALFALRTRPIPVATDDKVTWVRIVDRSVRSRRGRNLFEWADRSRPSRQALSATHLRIPPSLPPPAEQGM